MRTVFLLTFFMLSLCGCEGNNKFADILEDIGGGTGSPSIAILSYAPAVANVSLKVTGSQQQFLVSATGRGTLVYKWTLDGSEVGGDSTQYNLDPTTQSLGFKTLKVEVSDELGSVSQEWTVKINGTPVIGSYLPTVTEAKARRSTDQTFSVSVSDPNSDSLTYVWKVDGNADIISSTNGSATWTPALADVGSHTLSVDIYDGPISDTGTYSVTQTWNVLVNHFASSCNTMENSAQTNKTCVYVGIAGVGDGLDPETSPSDFFVRPTALAMTNNNNLFISDTANSVIWFYNKYTSPSITVLGVTVPINTMKVVAGVGMAGSGASASTKALRNFLSSPEGIYWDGSNLYVADTGNNRGIRIDNTGTITSLFTASCTSPRSLVVVGSYLYVTCYSNHKIGRIDLTGALPAVPTTFAGTGAAGNPTSYNESSFTDATNGVLNGPYGMTADSSGNLYVSEYTGCRVRFYNLSGAPLTLYGTYAVSDNNQRIILGNFGAPSCSTVNGEAVNLTGATDARVGNIRQVSLTSSGVLLVSSDLDVIHGVNFSAVTTPILGVSLTGYFSMKLFGSGTAGYIGEGGLPTTTRFNNPYHALEDSTSGDYYVADYTNMRLRKMQAANYRSTLIAGTGVTARQTNAGQGQIEAGYEKMNSVRGLAYDSVSRILFISDSGNNRIRMVNRYGEVTQAVGTGSVGGGAEEDELPSNVSMNTPRGLVLTHANATFGGHLVWADTTNHRIRIYNRSTADATLFGVTVSAGRVSTIGGDGTAGNQTTGSALQSAFNSPSGVAFDGVDLYVADTSNHCIKKIAEDGALSAVAGTCGTSGNVNGAVGVGRMNGPQGIEYYVNGSHTGLVIADQGNARVKYHRLAGSAILFGAAITVGDTNTIGCGGSFHTDGIFATLAPCSGVYDVATVGTKVCFANYGYHNVRCILASGEISTVMGALQGVDDTLPLYFPGTSLSAEDFNSSAAFPQYTSQNGVTAYYLPSPLGETSYNDSLGKLAYPLTLRALDSSTIVVADYSLGIIRKIKLP